MHEEKKSVLLQQISNHLEFLTSPKLSQAAATAFDRLCGGVVETANQREDLNNAPIREQCFRLHTGVGHEGQGR